LSRGFAFGSKYSLQGFTHTDDPAESVGILFAKVNFSDASCSKVRGTRVLLLSQEQLLHLILLSVRKLLNFNLLRMVKMRKGHKICVEKPEGKNLREIIILKWMGK
jgi:hypothetical protein